MYTADYESALESKQSEVREMPVTCAAAASFKILQTHRHNTHTDRWRNETHTGRRPDHDRTERRETRDETTLHIPATSGARAQQPAASVATAADDCDDGETLENGTAKDERETALARER